MKCRICSNEKDNRSYGAQEMMFGTGEVFQYFQCAKCNCLQIKDFPSSMAKYYPDNYYSYQPICDRSGTKKILSGLRDTCALYDRGSIGDLLCAKYPNVNTLPLRSLRCLSLKKDTNILDVGCGAGGLLYALSELGFNNLLGVDPFNTKDIEYENGLRILKKELHDVDGKWDLVMFHHSFEHLHNPKETLETVSRLLKTNGHCLIRVPTVSSYAWEYYGVKWVQLDAPRHFYLHSVGSIRILADKSGLELGKIVYDSTSFQFWGSEQYRKDIPSMDQRSYWVNRKGSIFAINEIAAYERRARLLNEEGRGDQAIFYLKNPK